MGKKGWEKKGQVAVFVIIAVVIVAAVGLYFLFRSITNQSQFSPTFNPVESQILNCISQDTSNAVKIAETHAGYITSPAFVAGSSYMPYSSQLDFAGTTIPYWRSISGNNLPINQIPTLKDMQDQIAGYINSQIKNCDLSSFIQEGYSISMGSPDAQVQIGSSSVKVSLSMDVSMKKGNQTSTISTHQVQINSEIGSLYNDAIKFYDIENTKKFLENYSVDILNLYAPVDGFDLSCSPKTWDANEIFSGLKNATQDNFMSIRNNGPQNDYFAMHLPISSSVRIINSPGWPSTYEVEPANSPVLVANPVGNQQGLGMLGFCYVPYHFVYTLRYPVLVQLTKNGETFQFPLSIDIENNLPAGANITGSSVPDNNVNLCAGPYSNVTVNLIGSGGSPVDGNITYNCFSSSCYIGKTKGGTITGLFPQCVNGQIVADSNGYMEASHMFTTLNGGSTTVSMRRIYQKTVFLNLTNSRSNEKAIITFSGANSSYTQTVLYPQQNQVNLSEGEYNVQLYVFDNSTLKFNATTIQTCTDVPSGILGIFGVMSRQCSSTDIPAQNISNILVAGGNSNVYFSAEELSQNNHVEIDTSRFNTPTSLQQLQIVYTLVEGQSIGVNLS